MAGNQYSMKDFTRFTLKFQAVVDWAEIEVRTATPRTYHDLRHTLPHDISFARDTGANQAGTVWRFKIHDVERWEQVDRVVLALDAKIGLQPLTPNAPDLWHLVDMEVAVDVRITGQESMQPDELKAALAEIAENLAHGWTIEGENKANWRFPGDRGTKGHVTAADHRHRNRRALENGRVLVIGDQHDQGMVRSYIKSDTEKNGKRTLIKQNRWSARFERTNLLVGLPPMTPPEAKAFKFESLAGLWRFRTTRDEVAPLIETVQNYRHNIGTRYDGRLPASRSYRVNHPHTQADPINERFRQALRNLTQRAGKVTTEDAKSGFSVKTSSVTRMDAGFFLRTT